MRLRLAFVLLFVVAIGLPAADDYKPGPDSLPQAGVSKGELIKGQYTAKKDSLFPGTERDYTIYLPPGLDKTKPAPFMLFQDGVIYQAPAVFDNLLAKKEIPPLIGIFIKPGVVPAANPNALPRFNRSYEYDSVTDTYARFLIGEFLPAISQKHGLNLSTDPNDAAIAGNSSGGICAFMVAWHCPDRFRRVFTGVGTYVGIHGADQLPVLVRKMEPKPLRVYLQSGTHDNDLYCGDWWMANQTMERSLTWAGYDVNHTWGEGGHNQKHATAIFPDVLRWLWKGWPEQKEIKANPRGDSKWKGYEVLGDWSWSAIPLLSPKREAPPAPEGPLALTPDAEGNVWVSSVCDAVDKISSVEGKMESLAFRDQNIWSVTAHPDGMFYLAVTSATPASPMKSNVLVFGKNGEQKLIPISDTWFDCVAANSGWCYAIDGTQLLQFKLGEDVKRTPWPEMVERGKAAPNRVTLSPDQSLLYVSVWDSSYVWSFQIQPDGHLDHGDQYFQLEQQDGKADASGLCVDKEGRLYVATALGIQVCDQAGRVNFIIPTPEQPQDVCFGGKDLGDLFIACENKIYKRPMKVHGIVSGQMAPIKPKPPHL